MNRIAMLLLLTAVTCHGQDTYRDLIRAHRAGVTNIVIATSPHDVLDRHLVSHDATSAVIVATCRDGSSRTNTVRFAIPIGATAVAADERGRRALEDELTRLTGVTNGTPDYMRRRALILGRLRRANEAAKQSSATAQ